MPQFTRDEVRAKFLAFAGQDGFTDFAKQVIYFLRKAWTELPPQLTAPWGRFCDNEGVGDFTFKFICETTLWCVRHDEPVGFNRGPVKYRPSSFQGQFRATNIETARLVKHAETSLFPFGFGVVNCPVCSQSAIDWLNSNSLPYEITDKPTGPLFYWDP